MCNDETSSYSAKLLTRKLPQRATDMLDVIFMRCNEVLLVTIVLPPGGYNPDECEELPVGPEVHDLFQYIMQYKPEVLQLDTPLKPFIPEFVPAIGDIDEFIKVNADALACGQQHLTNKWQNCRHSSLGVFTIRAFLAVTSSTSVSRLDCTVLPTHRCCNCFSPRQCPACCIDLEFSSNPFTVHASQKYHLLSNGRPDVCSTLLRHARCMYVTAIGTVIVCRDGPCSWSVLMVHAQYAAMLQMLLMPDTDS